ncbi:MULTISPECIES: M23 family metallopeptidase [unclassified Streptomyces]|uniref:M23 family metallopeptidase n=1 Tax=Streptomyces sp. NBRC 14336 TaxID=3030992 RepID=UPI002556E859|nr:M23 family metallopeptidase [Streptomyces sp. NBRC 14336]WBO80616.1 M23 family metallopeptidase [Streptomyces sp. SBE_14.2]
MRAKRCAVLLVLAVVALFCPRAEPPLSPAAAVSAAPWPVPGATVLRGWEPPPTPYARGHRGVDLAALVGTPVRAVRAGRVFFAGRVAGRGVVSVEHPGTGSPPLRTTYTPMDPRVEKGAEVRAGEVIGTVGTGPPHCAVSCLHWGLRRGETYLNPLTLLYRGPSRLLPVLGVPLP